MPGAAARRIGRQGYRQRPPEHRLDLARAAGPRPEQHRHAVARKPTMVDSRPIGVGPASRMHAHRIAEIGGDVGGASVGLTWPERLALGAASGLPNAASSACATGCAGTRIATVSSPAVTRSAIAGVRGASGGPASAAPARTRSPSRAASGDERRRSRAPPRVVGDVHDQRIEARASLGHEDVRRPPAALPASAASP